MSGSAQPFLSSLADPTGSERDDLLSVVARVDSTSLSLAYLIFLEQCLFLMSSIAPMDSLGSETPAEDRDELSRLRAELVSERQLRRGLEARLARQTEDQPFLRLSHDLRSPLNCILGYAEFMLDELESLEIDEVRESLKRIKGSGRSLLTMLEDTLELTRLQMRKRPLCRERFDLEPTVLHLIEEYASKNGNRISCEAAAGPYPVWLDPALTAKALRLALDTAAALTEGELGCRIDANEDRIVLRMGARAGIGARDLVALLSPPDHAPGDCALTSRTTLAISIARETIHAHGGRLCAELVDEALSIIIEVPRDKS